ncbi:DNA primase [Candidatus Woesearchaeota archaeon]|nr:DNA primase [Candidatus Woesearchaeota archaeon]
MGKISPVAYKYIIHASIEVDGVVDRPDVIGAIFGQTEGLLGAELELRELQRSGRIGRIEVNTETRGGKSKGAIIIPSSLDKAETAIIGAALEIIQRIGPCNAVVHVTKIEDVRITKRVFVVDRAKILLKNLMEQVMPDSQEITEEVTHAVRVMEIQEYGPERLPAGPGIEESEELIIVEGRADVLNLLKNGFKNVIALNGTSVPPSVAELSKRKEAVAFVDGDRGGNLIIKELSAVGEIDFVARAPDGKEVEELTKKEIHKSIRDKVTLEQALHEIGDTSNSIRQRPSYASQQTNISGPQSYPQRDSRFREQRETEMSRVPMPAAPAARQKRPLTAEEKKKYGSLLEDLIGTKGAYLVDEKLSILGKVPMTELASTVKSIGSGIHALILDGILDPQTLKVAEQASVQHVIAMSSQTTSQRVSTITPEDL